MKAKKSEQAEMETTAMPLLEHLIELRRRLLYSMTAFAVFFFVGYNYATPVYDFLTQPLASAMREVGGSQRMIFTALTEAFFTQIQVGFFVGGVLSFPIIAAQVWMFVAPGLYKHEKKAFLPFLVVSPVLFAAGAALVYYFVIPLAWRFLLGFQTGVDETALPIQLEAKVDEYLSLTMKLIFAFGLSFQLPVLLTLLARVGLVSSAALKEKRRYAIVGIFVVAAVITPPDVISQIGLAIPLIVLYEMSILSCRSVERQRQEVESGEEMGVAENDFNES